METPRRTDFDAPFDVEKKRGRVLSIEGARIAFLVAITLLLVLFQIRQAEFIGVDVLFPVYFLLGSSFLVNAAYIYFFDRLNRLNSITSFLFGFDTVFITAMIYFTGITQSIFIFMYLVNIILCGFIFQRRGAFVLALWTSIMFSFLLILSADLRGQTLYFAVGLNNLAFFLVAGLAGYLSEQINFMGLELKAAGKDIQALRDLNTLIVENISTGLMTVDRLGNVLLCNNAANTILGYQVRIGSHVQEAFPQIQEHLLSEQQQHLERFEVNYFLPNHEKLLLGCSLSPLLDSDNQSSGHILIFQDLTQIKRLERAMQRSEKLAAIGQLAASIAHEIRNPLASISGSVQLLKSNLPMGDFEDRKLMEIVLKEINRLNLLITEFLNYVRPDIPSDDPVEVESLLKEVLDMSKVNDKLRHDVTHEVHFSGPYKVFGQRDKLKQAFLNLVINAYEAMDKSTSAVLSVTTGNSDGVVWVKISDTGSGMDERVLKRLFEPFHTTKPQGTGLGLAMTHKILQTYEARIHVESTVGRGSEFTIEFTRVVPSGQASRSHSELKRGDAKKRGLG